MKKTIFPLTMLLAATTALYIPSLGNYLVADSWTFMLKRPFLENFSYFFKTMLPPEFNALWLRPIPMFTYWLDTVLWPGTNWGPHLLNIVFHLLNVWLIWLLVRFVRTRKADGSTPAPGLPEFAACSIYGLHPLNVGSVAWVAARFDVMSVTFGLAGLYCWFRWLDDSTKRSRLAIAVLFLMLALFSKEQAVIYSAVCLLSAVWVFAGNSGSRKALVGGLAALSISLGLYVLLRLIVFHGLGGYLEARHGLSLLPPLYYLAGILYPFPNALPGPDFSLTVVIAAAIISGALYFLLKTGPKERSGQSNAEPVYLASALLLCIFGLLTNMPNPGLTFDRIVGHAESRFAINAVTGLALAAGFILTQVSGKKSAEPTLAVLTALLAVSFVWRSDVQIQAWRDAGTVARLIVEDTVRLAPKPRSGSRLIFIDIPRNNDQWAYIFGIGLKEALYLKYGRDDFDVVRFPKREDIRTANPERDVVIRYIPASGRLERLHAMRAGENEN